ncbi:unnamed protein product [Zymoseptoria tritici ST99CH_1A5]|uniref:protein-ribulosamine 3-kinase n=1 Tax=Zymoseptoria tritici ST99CH_1A5 TaxID=1276529 RepID=A0A1Y6L984_ZYMTR|nr:unnamed protein product [Zymoseptoria tritici ST99CH_1A5]
MAGVEDVIPDVGSNVELDPNVRRVLPHNSTIISSYTYGTAAWTRAARITILLEDGSEKSYFLKCASEDQGKAMIEGEFASISEIAKYTPSLTPIPHAHGQFEDASIPTYFFLMEFLNIETGAPEPATISKQLADLHARSVSPTGKFGYHMITCHGPHPQDTRWEESWAVFFARLLRQFHDREVNTNGPSKDGRYETEMDKLITSAIPEILGPLQANGRTLKPALVHGDLWEENCGKDLETGQPKIFDAAVFYGHNEYDLGMWRRELIRFGRPHIRQYLRHMPPSEPKEQWDDRSRLYCIKFEIAHSIGWPASCESQREIIMREMRHLNNKYIAKD